ILCCFACLGKVKLWLNTQLLGQLMGQTISEQRLLLRPFTLADSSVVQRLASDAKVAKMAGNLPYPYPEGGAKA
ncbi:MAG: GNAT family N-acetyltransferase, partial [Oceanospirillaceae bacterium]|nr:GNAT family N-acetyltransferase [Oceanospirillaceae bacterium]